MKLLFQECQLGKFYNINFEKHTHPLVTQVVLPVILTSNFSFSLFDLEKPQLVYYLIKSIQTKSIIQDNFCKKKTNRLNFTAS